jgi:chaperone BCS1
MASSSSKLRKVVAGVPGQPVELYREPVTTPGLVPRYLKRATVDAYPLIEVMQRFLAHMSPGSGSAATIEGIVALVALYKVIAPVWRYATDLFLRSLTSRISIPEHDPVAQEILQWVAAEVVNKSRLSTRATVMTGDISRLGPELYSYIPGIMSRMLSMSKVERR